jgi:spore coat polysaccharide biosynthesis protein SpsF
MGSSRLPGKVLVDIGGRSMLDRVVSGARRARIVDECNRLSVGWFRGSENDVLDRYYCAARRFGAETVVRITSDCPLIDPSLIDRVIAELRAQGADYASNTLTLTYPRGLDAEAFPMTALATAWENASASYERIHVTPYLYRRPDQFKLVNVACTEDVSMLRWTVDTPDDLELVRRIIGRAPPGADPDWEDVLAIVRGDPALRSINAHIRQKALEEG